MDLDSFHAIIVVTIAIVVPSLTSIRRSSEVLLHVKKRLVTIRLYYRGRGEEKCITKFLVKKPLAEGLGCLPPYSVLSTCKTISHCWYETRNALSLTMIWIRSFVETATIDYSDSVLNFRLRLNVSLIHSSYLMWLFIDPSLQTALISFVNCNFPLITGVNYRCTILYLPGHTLSDFGNLDLHQGYWKNWFGLCKVDKKWEKSIFRNDGAILSELRQKRNSCFTSPRKNSGKVY